MAAAFCVVTAAMAGDMFAVGRVVGMAEEVCMIHKSRDIARRCVTAVVVMEGESTVVACILELMFIHLLVQCW